MRKPAWTRLGLMVLALAVVWPAAAPPLAAPAGVWLDVPYVRQPPDGCGAACISMVLRYWTIKDQNYKCALPGIATIQRALYSPKAHGIYASAMERYLRAEGMLVYPFRGSLVSLRDHLTKGRPLIVCLREGRTLHYVVVVGLSRNAVLVNDPAGEKLEPVGRSAFERKWAAQNDWTLLAVPAPKP